MRLQVCAPLFYILAFLPVASSTEFHAEHEAVHQMPLWRRSQPEAGLVQKQKMRVAIGVHDQRLMNISTKLEDQKSEYIGEIGVGTNADGNALYMARVVFDTGSTNLWVASNLCKDFAGYQAYDPKQSMTQEAFKGSDTSDIDITFGTGELRGPLHVDTLRVGPMAVKQQPFAMIREMIGGVFSSFAFEGILGLGFKSLSFGGIEPFFERVIQQKVLPNNEFAFFMNVDSGKPSALLWGGIDKDLYHGKIRMFPVVQPHYWALELVDFKFGNESMGPVKRLIVDSGTTYFTAPTHLHGKLTDRMREADCDKVKDYPPLTYVLKGADGETYELVVTQETYMIGGGSQGGVDVCRPAFMALDVANQFGPAMLLGEVFMRHFFTVFSRGDGNDANAKVGIAPANVNANAKVKTSHGSSSPATQPVLMETGSSKAAKSDRKRIYMGLNSHGRPQKESLLRREA